MIAACRSGGRFSVVGVAATAGAGGGDTGTGTGPNGLGTGRRTGDRKPAPDDFWAGGDLGCTEETVEPEPLGTTEADAAKLQAKIDALRRKK